MKDLIYLLLSRQYCCHAYILYSSAFFFILFTFQYFQLLLNWLANSDSISLYIRKRLSISQRVYIFMYQCLELFAWKSDYPHSLIMHHYNTLVNKELLCINLETAIFLPQYRFKFQNKVIFFLQPPIGHKCFSKVLSHGVYSEGKCLCFYRNDFFLKEF